MLRLSRCAITRTQCMLRHVANQQRQFSVREVLMQKLNPTAQAQVMDELMDPEEIERQTRELMDRIKNQQQEISDKTKQGRRLVEKVSESIHVDQFERDQRYEIFINKMYQLYKYEKRALKRQRAGFLKMATAPLMTETPVKLILTEYNNLSSQGFDGRIISQTLEHLVQNVNGRGQKPRVFTDYSLPELDTSWRMSKVAEDLKYALTSDQFFSSHLMAKSARLLGELGYKNTEILPLWFQKIERVIEEQQNYKIPDLDTHELFQTAIYGSSFHLKPRHYVYKGHLQHEEFQSHLQTLMDWQAQQKTSPKRQKNTDKEVVELEEAMGQLIEQVKEIKGLAQDQQAAISSLRDQYFRLKDAQDKHAFLKANKYLRYDMLELQELLVKGGFIDPQEALNAGPQSKEERMARAADVFYDLVLNQHDELLSPQYNLIHEAAIQRPEKADINEHQNYLNAYTYSSIIIGVAEQAQSFRRDVHGHDYPNKFYEDLLMPPEYLTQSDRLHKHFKEAIEKTTPTNVLMERSYIKAWRDFYKLTENVAVQIEQMLQSHRGPRELDSNIVALRALSECKFSAPELRTKIYKKINEHKKGVRTLADTQVLIDGLMGIAHGSDRSFGAKEAAQSLMLAFDKQRMDNLKFRQKIELLNGICVSDLLEYGPAKQNARIVVDYVIRSLDDLHFDVIDNELSYDDFVKLHEAYLTIKLSQSEKTHAINFKNQNLLSSLENPEVHLMRYPESHAAWYDPLKPRLVSGLAAGLSQADMEVLYEWQQGQTTLEAFDGKNKFPFAPDILCGHRGAKVGVYLTNERQTMRDSKLADGRMLHRIQLVERAHDLDKLSAQVLPVTIPFSEVIDYDLESFKLSLKPNFDISRFIKSPKRNDQISLNEINTQPLADVAAKLIEMNREAFEKGNTSGELEKLIGQFYHTFDCKRRLDLLYEQEQKAAAFDELKFHIMKLKLVSEALLSKLEKEQLQACLPEGTSFEDLIEQVRKDTNRAAKINKKLENKRESNIDKRFDQQWIGQRQMVELPKPTEYKTKKEIIPELFNRSYLSVQEYHHYADWKAAMEETYDQFNLLQLPRDKNQIQVYFDPARYNRMIPYGLFPLPTYKRTPLLHSTSEPLQITEDRSHADRFAEFEKDPMGYMRKQELLKMSTLKDITPEVAMMTNLQNVKQGLKAELDDKQLADLVFSKFAFTNELIKDHLHKLSDKPWQSDDTLQHVPRDPKAYRDFVCRKEQFNSPYNQFYLREALKQGFPQGLYEEYEAARKDPRQQDKAEQLLEQIENSLVNYKRGNEDFFNLSKALDNYLEVSVDIQALGMTEAKPLGDPVFDGLSDAQFLRKQRVLAETALIKATIIYKCHSNIKLNSLERRYCKMWIEQANELKSLVTGENLMVPESPSNLRFKQLSPEDLYTLNNLPGVSFDRSKHGSFAVNDLVLELAHLVDRETIKKVELSVLEERLKSEFELDKTFTLVQSRNKEVDYLHQELEEISWRMAATFDEKDKAVIKGMFSLGRGIDHFDKVFFDLDNQSFEAFFEEANTYDNRNTLIENWLCRKEYEYRNRVNLPTKELRKPDQELFAKFDSTRKNARENLVSQMIETEKGKQRKTYSSLTTKELNMLIESIVVRLNLFSQKYPAFLPQVIKAIMEHPNLSNFDRANLDTYCTVFELDWRGDRNIDNREEFLMTNPIYINRKEWLATNTDHFAKFKDPEYIKERVKLAHTPFLDDLVKSMEKEARQAPK